MDGAQAASGISGGDLSGVEPRNRREDIFRDNRDRELFLSTLAEACGKTGWEVQALCLLGNHFHLVVETPQGNLVAGMKWFLGAYTGRFNRRHKLFGHLFSGRYKALIVDGSGNGYFKTVCDYVHLNPVRARLLGPEQDLRLYRWSSWPEYLKAPGQRWPWLRVDRLLVNGFQNCEAGIHTALGPVSHRAQCQDTPPHAQTGPIPTTAFCHFSRTLSKSFLMDDWSNGARRGRSGKPTENNENWCW